jgi:hypothetical protein
MSSDECEVTTNVIMYAQRTHKWWSATLQKLLKDIQLWLKKDQHIILPYSESGMASKRPAPTRLPKFCYGDEWLQGLMPGQRKDLQMT